MEQNSLITFNNDCLGWASGGCGPAGAEKDRQAASGRLRLAAHRNGFLPHERGSYVLNESTADAGILAEH